VNDTAQIILSVATLVTSLGTIILGLYNRKTALNIEKQTNGLMVEMKATARKEGVEAGKEIQFKQDHTP
jgi:hypothetical protein